MTWPTVVTASLYILGGGLIGYVIGRQREAEDWIIRWGSHRVIRRGRIYRVTYEGPVRAAEVPPDSPG